MGRPNMPTDSIDENAIDWHEAPQIDEDTVDWNEAGQTDQGWKGNVAAGMRGALEQIPGGRDIAAGLKAYVGNPLTGEAPSGDFSKSKQALEQRNAELAAEHPWSYGIGEVAGGVGSLLAPEAAGLGLLSKGAKAEEAVANLLSKGMSKPAAEIAAETGLGAATGATQSAVHGLGTGTDLEERIGHAKEEIVPGAALGAVGAGIGNIASKAAKKIVGGSQPINVAPTLEEIRQQSKNAYAKSKAHGLKVNTAPLNTVYNDIIKEMKSVGYNPRNPLHTGVSTALDELKRVNTPQTLEQLDQMHRMTTAAIKNWNNPEGQMMAAIYRKHLDNLLENLDPRHTVTNLGTSKEAVGALKEGREYWKRFRKTQQLEEALETAKDRAASTGVGGNIPNAFRQEVKKIYDKAKKQNKMWTPDEMQAMRNFVRGNFGSNILRYAAKLSPIRNSFLGPIEFMGLFSHPGMASGAAGVGLAAQAISDKLTKRAGKRLEKLVAAGGQKAKIAPVKRAEPFAARSIGVPTTVGLATKPQFGLSYAPISAEDREQHASGGAVGLSRMEKAVARAQKAIANETKPLMEMPDAHIAHALEIAKDK